MDEYCRRYAKQNRNLPPSQLLLHKEQKVALCYVPEAAGTIFKVYTPTVFPRNASQSIDLLHSLYLLLKSIFPDSGYYCHYEVKEYSEHSDYG